MFTLTIGRVLVLAAVALLCKVLLNVFYNLVLNPLRSIPGPFLARVTRLWELNAAFRGRMQEELIEMHKMHGPVVRVAPNVYSFSEADDMKTIYRITDSFPKTNFYHTSGDPSRPNVFSMTVEKDHAQRKRKLAGLYSMSTMVHYELDVDRVNAVLDRKFQDFAASARSISLPDFMQYYAFDVIGAISVGGTFGFMEKEGDVDGFIATVRRAILYMGTIGLFGEWHPLMIWLNARLGVRHAGIVLDEKGSESLLRAEQAMPVDEKTAKSDTFVSKLIQAKRTGKMNKVEIVDSIGANIAAGSDTTAITLSAAFYYLYKDKEVLTRLRAELDAADTSEPVTFEEAQTLPYLQAVIKEALRIHPAVGYILRRTVPEGGAELAGRHFPQGTQVGVSAWVLHHNENVTGEDHATFRPERWLEGDDTSKAKAAMSFAFGGGSRICLGKNISLLEMNKVIPLVVRKYDFEFDGGDPWELFCTWFVWPQYKVRVVPRSLSQGAKV